MFKGKEGKKEERKEEQRRWNSEEKNSFSSQVQTGSQI